MQKLKLVRGIPDTSMPDFHDGRPIDEGTYGLCVDAFVSVFNEGVADEQKGCLHSMTPEMYWESMFKQDDWAASMHPRLPYWVYDRANRRKLKSSKNFYIKHTKGVNKWTAERIRKQRIRNVVKRMVGFAQDIPGSCGEMLKMRG